MATIIASQNPSIISESIAGFQNELSLQYGESEFFVGKATASIENNQDHLGKDFRIEIFV